MAKNLTLFNMRDMLALVTDAALQRKFIKLYAPSADGDIDWNGLESIADISRAEMIESALNKLNATVERKKQLKKSLPSKCERARIRFPG